MGIPIVRIVGSGNIQRSPTGEAVLSHEYSQMIKPPVDLVIDSAGMGVYRILMNETPADTGN
jgi:protein-tyrosine-phosphatase